MKKILFGAGEVGTRILKRYFSKGEVIYFCDNNRAGEVIEGIEVISLEKLKQIAEDYEIIISVEKPDAKKEIKALLEDNNLKYKEIDQSDDVKHFEELAYWKEAFIEDNGHFSNDYYRNLMLSIASEKDDGFLSNLVVADFGCGPRGSLEWIKSTKLKIGIDVLVPQYFDNFGANMINHGMIYVTSTEQYIPLPDESLDCLITINSLDHVRNLKTICNELIRVLKKGGMLLGSFNLNEPTTECEPQTLTEELLNEDLLKYFDIVDYRLAKKQEDAFYYQKMIDGDYIKKSICKEPCILWVRGIKNE